MVITKNLRRVKTRVSKLVFVILMPLFLTGCIEELLTSLMGDINNSMNASGGKNEQFDIGAFEFWTSSSCDDPWFCESTIREQVYKGVKKGIKYVEEKRDNVSWSDAIPLGSSKSFYTALGQTADEKGRRIITKKTAEKYGVTGIVFGQYTGDDYNMILRAHLYYINRDTIARSDPTKFRRTMPESERIEKTARLIRDIIIETLDG